jgi:tetratricopeptide (TPR) repeat protein
MAAVETAGPTGLDTSPDLPPGVDPALLRADDRPERRLDLGDVIERLTARPRPEAEMQPPALPTEEARLRALAHYARGRTALLERKLLRAGLELERAHELDPASPAVLRELAYLAHGLGNLRRAAAHLQASLVLDPEDPEALLMLGILASERREFEPAAYWLARRHRAVGQAGDDLDDALHASYLLSTALRHLGYDLASIQAGEPVARAGGAAAPRPYVRRLGPIDRGAVLQSAGDAWCRLGETGPARASYVSALSLDGADRRSLVPRLLYVALRLGRPLEAQQELMNLLRGADPRGADGPAAPRDDLEVRLCRYLAANVPDPAPLAAAVGELAARQPDDPLLVRAAAELLPPDRALALLRGFANRHPRQVDVVGRMLAALGEPRLAEAVDVTLQLMAEHPDLAGAYAQRLAFALPRPFAAIHELRGRSDTPQRCDLEARLLVGYGALGAAWEIGSRAGGAWPGEASVQVLRVELAGLLGEPTLLEPALADAARLTQPWVSIVRSAALRAVGHHAGALEQAEAAAAALPREVRARLAVARSAYALAGAGGPEQTVLGHARRAEAAALAALELEPADEEAYSILGQLYQSGGALTDARQLARLRQRLLDTAPHSRAAALLAAQDAMAQRRPEEALDRLLAVYESDPMQEGVLESAITAWAQAGRLEDAERWLEARRAQRPGDPALLQHWVRVAMELQRFDAATSVVRDIAAAEPDHVVARQLHGALLAAQGRHVEAALVEEEWRLRRPLAPRRELALAIVYSRAQRVEDALRRLEWVDTQEIGLEDRLTALAVAGDLRGAGPERDHLLLSLAQRTWDRFPEAPLQVYASALVALARLEALEDGRFDEVARRAIESAPGAADPTARGAIAWRQMAQSLVAAGQPLAAARALRVRLRAMAPLEPPARSQITLMALVADAASGGQAAQSLALLEELSARNALFVAMGDDTEPMTLLESIFETSNVYSILGDEAGADLLLREVVARGEMPMAFNNLGYLRLESGLAGAEPEVERYILEALRLMPEDASVLDTAGWLRYRQGRLTDPEPAAAGEAPALEELGALALIRRAIERDADPSPEVFDHLGDALYRSGDVEGARGAWARAAGVLEDPRRRDETVQRLFLIQSRLWMLQVEDPRLMYDRDEGRLLERVRAKLRALEESKPPAVAATFAELRQQAEAAGEEQRVGRTAEQPGG